MTDDELRLLPPGAQVLVPRRKYSQHATLRRVLESSLYPGRALADLEFTDGWHQGFYAKDLRLVEVRYADQLHHILFGGTS